MTRSMFAAAIVILTVGAPLGVEAKGFGESRHWTN